MSIFSKIMDSMKISNEPDDDEYYDDYDDYDEAPKKSIFKRNSAPEDDYVEEDEQPKGGIRPYYRRFLFQKTKDHLRFRVVFN